MIDGHPDQLARPKLKGVDEATIDRLVAENAKQRFHIKIEPNDESGEEVKWIRANQGHSIAVGFEYDLTFEWSMLYD